jgi:hypothetical protein
MRADRACELTQPEGPPELHGVEGPALGLPQHALRRERIEPAMRVLACMRPMAPKLVIPHAWRMLRIHALALRAAHPIRVEPPALDRAPACREMLPRMALGNGRPLDAQLAETGGKRGQHCGMITHHCLWGPPPQEGRAKDLQHPREIVPLQAARSHDSPTIAIKDQEALEPLPLDLHQIAPIHTPALLGRRRLRGAFVRLGAPCPRLRARMGLFVKSHPLPDGGMAIAIAQGISGHLHAIVAQERMVIQEVEDVHHRLDRPPPGERGVRPGLRRQPH